MLSGATDGWIEAGEEGEAGWDTSNGKRKHELDLVLNSFLVITISFITTMLSLMVGTKLAFDYQYD